MTGLVRFYLHGLPGSSAELDFALPAWRETGPVPLDRLSLRATHNEAVEAMASNLANYEAVHLIGFSLGAMSALKLASVLPETVTRLDLIAPAAPLELGDFLDQMAGKPIFEAALKGRLGMVASAQATLARLSNGSVIKAMFASAPDADKKLLKDKRMQSMLRAGLKHCLLTHQDAYKNELRAFVTPWTETLTRVTCPVTIWHGTADTWAPPGLSEALAEALGDQAEIKTLEGLGHYSALKEAMPNIAE